MSRTLVWIEQQRFRGFGCSECVAGGSNPGAPSGTSFDEMMRNFELQRDKEFTLHVCADHPSAKSTKLCIIQTAPQLSGGRVPTG
jgi:hypothetical protein